MGGYVVLSKQMIAEMINSLKQIDARGYESKDTLVACVRTLTAALNQPQASEPKQKEDDK